MNCPECGEPLEAYVNKIQDDSNDFIDVEVYCPNEHTYFVRIKEDDLIKCD